MSVSGDSSAEAVVRGPARCPRISWADAGVAAVARDRAQGMSARAAAARSGPGPGAAGAAVRHANRPPSPADLLTPVTAGRILHLTAGHMDRQTPRWNLTIRRSVGGQHRYVRGGAGTSAVRFGFLALPYPMALPRLPQWPRGAARALRRQPEAARVGFSLGPGPGSPLGTGDGRPLGRPGHEPAARMRARGVCLRRPRVRPASDRGGAEMQSPATISGRRDGDHAPAWRPVSDRPQQEVGSVPVPGTVGHLTGRKNITEDRRACRGPRRQNRRVR